MSVLTRIFAAKKIITMYPEQPLATAVAVKDGRILAVGELGEVIHWVKNSPFTPYGARRARWGYAAAAFAAYAILAMDIITGMLPATAWLAALPAALSATATWQLLRYAEQPHALAPAIRFTILAAVSHGLLLTIALTGAPQRLGSG